MKINRNFYIISAIIVVIALAAFTMGGIFGNSRNDAKNGDKLNACPECVCPEQKCPEKNLTCPECVCPEEKCPELECPKPVSKITITTEVKNYGNASFNGGKVKFTAGSKTQASALNSTFTWNSSQSDKASLLFDLNYSCHECMECHSRDCSCSCSACPSCPEPKTCNVSKVSECRNDTVADFDIELYLNGTLISEFRNGSYYYQNETVEAKVKPNRMIYVMSENVLYWHLYKYTNNSLVGVMGGEACPIPSCSEVCNIQYPFQCPPPDPSCYIINCGEEEWAWNQMLNGITTVTCPSGNQTVRICSNANIAEIGKYVIKFCYKTECLNIASYNAYGTEECIYREFELL